VRELVPGGVRKEITAAHAARILEAAEPAAAVEITRRELASDFLEDLRRIDTQMSQAKKKLAAAVKVSGTTLTEVFGVGPVIAAIVLAEVQDVSRIPTRDRFAAYNGTAPVEVSSWNRKVHRLSRRGNRRINHAIHMAAITQIRHLHSEGRAYYDKKLAEGKTPKEALRAPSSAASVMPSTGGYAPTPAALPPDIPRSRLREGKRGTTLTPARPAFTPEHQLFGTATPGPEPTLRSAPAAQSQKRSSRASIKMSRTT
jgi:transposase